MTFGLPSIHNYDYVEYVENIKRKRLQPGLPGSNITPKKKKRRWVHENKFYHKYSYTLDKDVYLSCHWL